MCLGVAWCFLGSSCGFLGPLLGHSGVFLLSFSTVLVAPGLPCGSPGDSVRCPWAHLDPPGDPWAALGPPRTPLDGSRRCLWASLGLPWWPLGRPWVPLGCLGAALWRHWVALGLPWGLPWALCFFHLRFGLPGPSCFKASVAAIVRDPWI